MNTLSTYSRWAACLIFVDEGQLTRMSVHNRIQYVQPDIRAARRRRTARTRSYPGLRRLGQRVTPRDLDF